MAKDPAYPMYAQDFDMDTASWPEAAVGIHVRLMNYSWINGPLPDDPEALTRIARANPENFEKFWNSLIKPKWKKTKEGLVSRRLEEERGLRREYVEKQREKGKKSAQKRWGKVTTVKPELQPGVQPEDKPEGQPEGNSSSSSSKKKKDIADAPKKGASPNPDIKTFIDYAFSTFQKTFNEKMLVDGGKDSSLIKKMLGTYDLDKLKRLWDVFLKSDDPFIVKAGRTIGVFNTQINKLISGDDGKESNKPLFGLSPEAEAQIKEREEYEAKLKREREANID